MQAPGICPCHPPPYPSLFPLLVLRLDLASRVCIQVCHRRVSMREWTRELVQRQDGFFGSESAGQGCVIAWLPGDEVTASDGTRTKTDSKTRGSRPRPTTRSSK